MPVRSRTWKRVGSELGESYEDLDLPPILGIEAPVEFKREAGPLRSSRIFSCSIAASRCHATDNIFAGFGSGGGLELEIIC